MDGSWQSWTSGTSPRGSTGGCQAWHLLVVCWLPSCEMSLEHFSLRPLWSVLGHLAPFGTSAWEAKEGWPGEQEQVLGRAGLGCWAPPRDAATPIMGAPATGFVPEVPPWMGQGCGAWLSLLLGCDIPDPHSQWTYQLHQSWAGAQHPLIPQSCTHPWVQGRHHEHVRPRSDTWSHVHMDSSSEFLRGKHLQEAAASKSLSGSPILHPQPPGTLSPHPPTLSPPTHPSRCASFFSRSWMTSSSTRMVCWLVSSTPSRDCSWECRSPCSPGPRGPSP